MTGSPLIVAVFLTCVAIAGAGWFVAKVSLGQLTASRALVLMSPFLFAPLVVAWGFALSWPGPEDTEPAWRMQATSCLLLLYPALCGFSIWRSAGYRWFAACLIPLSLLISVFAAVWAIACVTGD